MYFHAFLTRNEHSLKRKYFSSGNERITENISHEGSSLEKFVAVDDDNVCTAPIMANKDILEFVQNSKNNIVADSDDENEMNNAALDSKSSEDRNTMKSMHSYLKVHSNGEMENKMDIE
ncbi:hypothetical protein TNCV_4336741 [Trichonephila clavipes]|nr:hypothetical protein TNCV_4336741 [Trichonephila clavipes]